MKFSYRLLFTVLTTICLSNFVNAQDTVLNNSYHGKLDSIKSAILNQKRLIQVFTPAGYKPGTSDKYDVLYVLDGGNWNTGLIARTHQFLEGEGSVPPMIIVSVLGIDRNKDLTPTNMEGWKTSGGADNFLAFIKDELIPHVNKNYPSNGDNTLWGHSLGGLFVIHALLNQPATFKSYIAVDPSMWWDNNYPLKMVAEKLPSLSASDRSIFISGREGIGLTEMKIDSLDTIMKKSAPANLKWKLIAYPDETHSSVRLKTTYDGLKFTYAGLTPHIEFHPMNGQLLKNKPIHIWYFDDTTRVRYTLDGSVPKLTSPKALPEIQLNGPATVTYKRFTSRVAYDKSRQGQFEIGESLRPIKTPKNSNLGGFSYRYYEGDWQSWPDLKGIKPDQTGIADKDFDLDKLPRKKNYALIVEGLLQSKEDGYYIFLLEAEKNSRLYVGDKLLMEWDGSYQRRVASYILPLAKGFYSFRVEYLHRNEDFKLGMSYLTPAILKTKKPITIPFELQYSKPSR